MDGVSVGAKELDLFHHFFASDEFISHQEARLIMERYFYEIISGEISLPIIRNLTAPKIA